MSGNKTRICAGESGNSTVVASPAVSLTGLPGTGSFTIEDLDVSFHQYDTSLLPGHMSPRSIYHLEKKLNEKDKSIIEECINQKIISIDNNQIEPLVQKMTRYRLSNYKTSLIDKDKMIDYLLTLTK